ncbi:hypothetical protein MRBLMA1_002559 [Sphingobium sp. LMA1-1-1.1]|uniref:hypothetical protein n=1 Tax=unclassified Sphingobium TaxID=2611147 RepID=UPI003423EBD2
MLLSLLLAASSTALPSAEEVGSALAISRGCRDLDGYTNCNPEQPVGATFREVLCVEYGSDKDGDIIARCVFKGARVKFSGKRRKLEELGDGSIDVIYHGDIWLPAR